MLIFNGYSQKYFMKTLFHLLVIFLLSGAILSCNQPEKKSEADKTDTKGIEKPVAISNNGVNIAYTDTGRSDTTILFIHGWAINKGYWANQISYFGKKYRVVTMDLPGFGQSGKNRDKWDTKTYGSDVNAVISVHGVLKQPEINKDTKIKCRVLALHGYADKSITPEQFAEFQIEMNQRDADWQVHVFGNVMHSFTNPNANDVNRGLKFDTAANAMTWKIVEDFMDLTLA